MKKTFVLILSVLATVSAGRAFADESGLRGCRGISDGAARLACYDALPLPAPSAEPGAPARAPGSALKALSAGLVERFGLEHKAAVPEANRIESHIPGRFLGWKAKSLITLANGQVWQVVDDSWLAGEWDNPKVVVRRGILGGFFLDIDNENRSPRVRRVQ